MQQDLGLRQEEHRDCWKALQEVSYQDPKDHQEDYLGDQALDPNRQVLKSPCDRPDLTDCRVQTQDLQLDQSDQKFIQDFLQAHDLQ